MTNLYQEELLDHYRNPRNKGSLKNPDFVASDDNPSCGDRVQFEGIISENKVESLSFDGHGCILSQAVASMLTEECIHKTLDEIKAMSKDDVLKMVGITLGPNRIKCALLPLLVLQEGIKNQKGRL